MEISLNMFFSASGLDQWQAMLHFILPIGVFLRILQLSVL